MLEDVEASRRSTVESHLERVDLPAAAIGLDDGKGGWAEPERLGEIFPPLRVDSTDSKVRMPIGRSSDSQRSKMAISQSAYWVSWSRLGGSSQVAWGSRKSNRGRLQRY